MKTYLGDSVYAEFREEMIILTTDNGFGASNTICLESEVFDSLIRFVDGLGKAKEVLRG